MFFSSYFVSSRERERERKWWGNVPIVAMWVTIQELASFKKKRLEVNLSCLEFILMEFHLLRRRRWLGRRRPPCWRRALAWNVCHLLLLPLLLVRNCQMGISQMGSLPKPMKEKRVCSHLLFEKLKLIDYSIFRSFLCRNLFDLFLWKMIMWLCLWYC